MKIMEFFEESNGSLSSVRLMAFCCVMVGLFLVVIQTMHDKVVDASTLTILLGAGFGGKILSKPFEEKGIGTQADPPIKE